MAAPFHRVETGELIRGAARILYADTTTPKPSSISDVVYLTAGATEVQTITIPVPANPFTLTFRGYTTPTIAAGASAAAVQTALEALGSIGTGNVTVTGTGPYVVTFAGTLANQNVETISGTNATVAVTTPGQGVYDPKPGWNDLGATREGISISVNNSEDAFDIDQIQGDIGAAPTAWECSISTRLAEMTLERLQFVWEGSPIVTDAAAVGGPEREIGFAGATEYTERRIAILFKKPNGKIRAYLFHRTVRAPQEGTIDHTKGGDAQTVQLQLRVLADTTQADPRKQFFIMREQT